MTTLDLGYRAAAVAALAAAADGQTTLPPHDPIYENLLRQRIVFLGTEVDDDVANRIIAQLLLLSAEDPRKDITFYINSPGGSVTAGMAIYDTMQLVAPDVTTWGMGFVASMGQFLLTAGAPGKRYALPHTRILMHQPSGGITGSASDVRIRAEALMSMKREFLALTAERTGQTRERIEADADRDRWFTAEEAKAYGLVDQVYAQVPPTAVGFTRTGFSSRS